MSPSGAAADPVLSVEDLAIEFATREGVVRAVDGVSWSLDRRQTLGIVGESGSGKTVSALGILGLIPHPPGRITRGKAIYRGEDLVKAPQRRLLEVRGNDITMIFQDPMTALNPVIRIGKQVGEPLVIHGCMSKKDAADRAVELLDRVGIPNAAKRARDYPHEFSGGMRQRAMIAMAIACEPDILIADEPTTALDVTIQAQIIELLSDLQQRTGTAIILITHDLGVVAEVADQVLVMYAGKGVEYAQAETFFARPRHPYSWGLMRSVPRHDTSRSGQDLATIAGQPPSLIRVPPGCPFHPRCEYARPICCEQPPPEVDLGDGHWAACHFAGDELFDQRPEAATG